MKRDGILLWFLMALSALATVAQRTHADATQPLSQLQQIARDFLLAQHGGEGTPVSVRVSPLDPRLRLSACQSTPQPSWPPGARRLGSTTVALRCSDPAPWEVFVTAYIRQTANVLVTTRPLARGAVLTAADLQYQPHDLAHLPRGFETDVARVLGLQLKRRLASGEVLTPQVLTAPVLVRRGHRVSVVAVAHAMRVASRGVALNDAAAGETLRVRSLDSGRVIEGVVTGEGQVRIDI